MGLKCQELGCSQPPLWCFSRTHMERSVGAASGKEEVAFTSWLRFPAHDVWNRHGP